MSADTSAAVAKLDALIASFQRAQSALFVLRLALGHRGKEAQAQKDVAQALQDLMQRLADMRTQST